MIGALLLWLLLGPGLLPPVLSAQQDADLAYRIVESPGGRALDLDALADRVAAADVVLIGEQHDSDATHQVQRALLEAVADRRGQVTLALEMFERDVQETLDHFQMGHMSEDEMLAAARPWPRYAQHYKPLVDLAVERQWTVAAANVPRAIAASVAREGLEVLPRRHAAERPWFAADLQCDPVGAYFDRVVTALGTHGQTLDPADRSTYYQAQCLKDETMAESIVQFHRAGVAAGERPLVIGLHGAVHVDYRLGTVERVVRRLPQARVLTVTMVPADVLDAGVPDAASLARADFVIWVSKQVTAPPGGVPSADSSSSAP